MSINLSRRQFMGAVAGVGAASLLAPRMLRSADDVPATGKFGGFLLGIQSYSLRKFPAERALKITHDDLGLARLNCSARIWP